MFMKPLALCAALVLMSGVASADTIFSLNDSGCSSGCNVLPAGTVTLHQAGLNDVQVTVVLNSAYSFRNAPDANHNAFVFDLSGVTGVSATKITSGPQSQTFTFAGLGSYKDPDLGTFMYAFECPTCAKGVPSTPTQTLQFDLLGTGLTTASFISNGSYYFGVDVVGLNNAAGLGLTGNIGATGPGVPSTTSPVPEPSSLFLLGSGMAMAAGVVRRKLATA